MNNTIWTGTRYPARFFGWWGRELAGFLPAKRPAQLQRGNWTVVATGPEGLRLFDGTDGRLTPVPADDAGTDDRQERLARQLAQRAKFRGQPPLAVLIEREVVFLRELSLPASAIADAARIADLDLEQSTPFSLKDVRTAVRMMPAAEVGGRVLVEQVVVKRSALREVEQVLARAGARADLMDVRDVSRRGDEVIRTLGVNFVAGRDPEQRRGLAPSALLASLLGLLVLSIGIGLARLDATLSDLQQQTAVLKSRQAELVQSRRASEARALGLERVTALLAAQPSRVEILERLARLLPDTDHLSSLRIADRSIEIAGTAASAAALLLAIEQSGWLEKAAFTGPAVFDEEQRRERFSLRAEIKPAALRPTGSTEQSKP